MNQLAKDKKKWRHKINLFLVDNDLYHCEWPGGCSDRLGLAPAHRYKQRRILTEDEYMIFALLCQRHHHWVEYGDSENPGTHERMYDLVTDIYNRRSNGY